MTDTDHDLVDRLLRLHPPRTPEGAETMDDLRKGFLDLAHEVVDRVPRTPDRTIALRSIHRACMDTIAALACNQPGDPAAGEDRAQVGGTLARHAEETRPR